jgi:NADPH2:quinone reductase
MDFDVAAAFPIVYLTAFHLLHTIGNIREGGWVVLHAAAGGVGTAVIQLAKIAGAHVIGLTSSKQKAARARDLGLEYVFTYDHPNLVHDIVEASGGDGVDLVLDSVAGPNFDHNFDMLAPLGQVAWFGFAGGLPADTLLQSFGKHFLRGVGLRTFHLTYSVTAPYPEMMGRSLEAIMMYLREKKIDPVLADRIPLAEAARAHELLATRETVGKILLQP